MTKTDPLIALVLCSLSLVACGGDDKAKSEPAKAPPPPAQTAEGEGLGQLAVTECINEIGAVMKLEAESGQRLVMDGLDLTYDVVAVDEDGSLGQQVLVFQSPAAYATGAEQVEAGGFFDDVRPAGNSLVIRRGGTDAGTQLVEECALKG